MSLKKKIAHVAGACGGVWLSESLPIHSTRVIFYHGVSKEPLKGNLVQANQISFDAFRKQIDYFAKRYRFLSADEFYERFLNKEFSGRELLLTFDDGYANTAEVAAPYLVEKKIPFMVFVSAGLIETNRRGPSYYITATAYDPTLAELDVPSVGRRFSLRSEKERSDAALTLRGYVRSLNEENLRILLSEVVDASSREYRDEAWETYRSEGLMTWRQAEELSREKLAYVGSHCWDHAILHSGQSDEEVVSQLERSRDAVVKHCGKCDFLSYPNGRREYVSEFAAKKSADYYKASFGVNNSQLKKTDKASFIPRVGLLGDFYAALAAFSILALK